MSKLKNRILTIVLLVALFLGAMVGALVPVHRADATSYSAKNVFYAGSNGEVLTPSEEGVNYVQLSLANGGVVNYRHDLALNWYEGKGVEKYLELKFSFAELKFDTFTVTLESEQENVTKDDKTTNAIVFTRTQEEGSEAVVTVAAKCGDEDAQEAKRIDDANGMIVISLADKREGEYTVFVNNEEIGKIDNIGGSYCDYLSGSNGRIPLAFSATVTGDEKQLVNVVSLNGQSFELKDGMIEDNADPVLVLNSKINSFPLAQKFSLSYQAIDVLKDSVTVTRQYYIYSDSDEKVDYASLSTSTYLLPKEDGAEEAYVSIRFLLSDGRTKEGDEEDTYVYLSWYAADGAVVAYGETDYIPLVRNKIGPAYSCIQVDDANKTQTFVSNEAYEAYVAEVERVASESNAGEGSYFYLPSLRGLISDDQTDYSDLKFSIYYKNQSSATASSQTALTSSSLRFEIEKEGDYSFRVLATDKLGNGMMLYVDGELTLVTSSNIWDIEEIPQFNFSVKSKGATIEAPGEQSKGYIGSTYSVSSFDIVALDGYQVKYNLYFFDQTAYLAAIGNVMPTYKEMVEDPALYADYLVEIREYDSSVEEGDAAWENTDNDYEWYSSAKSFKPQEAGYYFVKATVVDSVYWKDQVSAYQVIEVSNPVDVIEGESNWLQNNMTTVILLSIAGVLLVALIVVLLIPVDRSVEEVDLKTLKTTKKSKKSEEEE